MPKLVVCFDCLWIFDTEDSQSCPSCNSEVYDGAREVFGSGVYVMRNSQKPWFDRKLREYTRNLRKVIEESQ